jgi:hypothetical protein
LGYYCYFSNSDLWCDTFKLFNLATKQEHKREIKVQLAYGFQRDFLGEVSSPLLLSSAMNSGTKTVTLTSSGLILPNKDKRYMFFVEPHSNVHFPYELTEGKSCEVWLTQRELETDLQREGFSGTIKVRGYYRDAIGNQYKSKPIKFNIESGLKAE